MVPKRRPAFDGPRPHANLPGVPRAARLLLPLLALALAAPHGEAARRSRKPATRRPPSSRPLPSVVLPALPADLDRAVAAAAERVLGRRSAAAVAMDPRSGRVLAVVNPGWGLFRAWQPCSVFKIVVGIAGLSEGVITRDTQIPCTRGCWMWSGHGPIDVRRALAVSCNPFFERVGEALGYARVQKYARLLGIGEVSGINLTGEARGALPLSCGPEAVGHLSSHAAGIKTNAVQLAVLISAAVNGGVVWQPQVAGPEGFVPRERWRMPPGTVYDGLAEGFVGAVNEGSAGSAFDPDLLIAGKTGTCSSVGWFASYYPADEPELVLVVFERGGSGHSASALAGRIYQEVFRPVALPPGAPAAGGGQP